MSLDYYLCSEFYTFLLAVFIFFFILRNALKRSDEFNRLANKHHDIKKLNKKNHYVPKLIAAPGYINDSKLRRIHIVYALETWFYFISLIVLVVFFRSLQEYMSCEF